MKGDVRTRFDFKRAGADHDVHEHPEVNPRSNSAARQQRRAAQAQAHGIVNERRRKKAHQNHTIDRWPKLERPREKLATNGASTLSDAELLAIFLRVGVEGQGAVDLARGLISRFGSVRALLSAPSDELNAVRGIGPATIAQWHAIGALTQRALAEELRSTASFDSPDVVRDYLKLLIGTRSYEVFVCLYLDARHCLIRAEESSHGTLTHTAVYPQKIARQALLCNAVALIVAHNHPSGNAEPSPSDFHLTKQLQAALALFDIRLLDHFVVSANSIMSFVEQKMLWNLFTICHERPSDREGRSAGTGAYLIYVRIPSTARPCITGAQ